MCPSENDGRYHGGFPKGGEHLESPGKIADQLLRLLGQEELHHGSSTASSRKSSPTLRDGHSLKKLQSQPRAEEKSPQILMDPDDRGQSIFDDRDTGDNSSNDSMAEASLPDIIKRYLDSELFESWQIGKMVTTDRERAALEETKVGKGHESRSVHNTFNRLALQHTESSRNKVRIQAAPHANTQSMESRIDIRHNPVDLHYNPPDNHNQRVLLTAGLEVDGEAQAGARSLNQKLSAYDSDSDNVSDHEHARDEENVNSAYVSRITHHFACLT